MNLFDLLSGSDADIETAVTKLAKMGARAAFTFHQELQALGYSKDDAMEMTKRVLGRS